MPEVAAASPRFTRADLKESFAAKDLNRGQAYANDGHVQWTKVSGDGHVITASVRGSQRTPYQVHVAGVSKSGQRRVVGSCSCPVGYNCKHAAAALLVVLEQVAGERDKRNAIATPAKASKRAISERLDSRIESWLDDLGRASEALKPAAGSASGDEVVAYIFGNPGGALHGRPAFPFESIVARRLVSGKLGRVRDCPAESLANATARAVAPGDALIGRLMRSGMGPQVLPSTVYEDVLRRVVATGRAFLRTPASDALRLAEPRRARLAWNLTSDGLQRPALDFDDGNAIVLPGVLPWYLDEAAHAIGPIESDVPAVLLAKILQAPPLSAGDARAVAARLEKRLPEHRIPAPRVVAETIENLEPVPTLTLRSVSLETEPSPYEVRSPVPAELFDLAELTFAYGGIAVDPANDEPERVVRIVENGTIVHPRKRASERRGAEHLRSLGLLPVVNVQSAAVASGAVFGFNRKANAEWPIFVHRTVPELRAAGWQVLIDSGFRHRVVDTSDDDAWDTHVEEATGGWFDISIGLDIDGRKIALLPVLRDLIASGGLSSDAAALDILHPDGFYYVRFGANGPTVAFPLERIKAIVKTLVELADPSALDARGALRLPRARAGMLDDLASASALRWDVPERLRALAERLRDFSGIARTAVPKTFKGVLRPYQHDGLDWLQFLREYGFGGILADDMGLGKSVQTIAHILCEKKAGRLKEPALLVVPTSLVFNWADEFARFAPSLRVVTLHGPDRASRLPELARCDVAITTYALLSRDAVFADRSWQLAILDEAQFLKNPQSKASQAAMKLRAEHRVCLTGTPVENHLGDLWSLFSVALPGALGEKASFGRIFRTPIEKHADGERQRALAERIRPFVLRRTKESVAAELPDKTEIVRRVELAGAQRDLYETVRIAMHDRVQEEIARSGLARSQIVILDALLKLRQVCCDPRLLPERFKAHAGSVKLDLLMEMLPEMIEEGRRILLFSQFTSMLDLIAPELEKRSIPFSVLTGQTKDRASSVKRFESGDTSVFLISLKAGGTGLNLVAADTVIHYDPWWNPAVERQATDRAHRIGQTKRVFVYKLIGAETVEEKILDLQIRKAALAASIFAEKPGGADANFGREDIERLFAPLGE